FFFFFSSRRRHTRCLSDWSSDVCSSDLIEKPAALACPPQVINKSRFATNALCNSKAGMLRAEPLAVPSSSFIEATRAGLKYFSRSEERRVGKEGRYRVWREDSRKE